MADSPAPEHRFCPFCGDELLAEQELSQDHVFGAALGGRVVVVSHKTCNNQSGSRAEGDLQRPNTLVNLLKSVRGLPAARIPGNFPSGRPAFLDLTDGSVQSPTIVSKADDGTSFSIEGPPAGAENAFTTWRARHPDLNIPEFKDLPPESITQGSHGTVDVKLTYPLRAAEIVAVKSALGACVLAYGSAFAVSEFAVALRALQDDSTTPQHQDRAILDHLDAQLPALAVHYGLGAAEISSLPHLVPAAGETVHDVTLVPIANRRTVLFAHYLSELIPPHGIVIDAPLPPLTLGLTPSAPLLLRDGGARNLLEITDFTQRLMQPTIDAAVACAPHPDPQP